MSKLLDVPTECCREIKQKNMKARIKKTGEIAEIYGADVREGENGSVTYYGADDLELIPDTLTTDSIDWEQRRYEISRSVLAGLAANKNYMNGLAKEALSRDMDDAAGAEFISSEMTDTAIEITDALISRLKK